MVSSGGTARRCVGIAIGSTGDSPVTYHNVSPLLTPTFQSFVRAELATRRSTTFAIESRYQGRSYLTNTDDPAFVLPAYTDVSASIAYHTGRYEILARANNLTDSKKYGSGYADGAEPAYFVLPPRNFFVTLKLDW